MATSEYTSNFAAPAPVLRRLFDKAKFAISTEETRYYLNGVYMHVATGDIGAVLRCVATDGHRLARIDAPLPDGANGMPGVIVPRKTVNELKQLLDDDEATIAAVSYTHLDVYKRQASGGVIRQVDQRPIGQFAPDFLQHHGRNRGGTGAFHHRGGTINHFDIQIGGAEGHGVAFRLDQHVGQDRNGIAAFDHRLGLRQRLEKRGAFYADLHGPNPLSVPHAGTPKLSGFCRFTSLFRDFADE